MSFVWLIGPGVSALLALAYGLEASQMVPVILWTVEPLLARCAQRATQLRQCGAHAR